MSEQGGKGRHEQGENKSRKYGEGEDIQQPRTEGEKGSTDREDTMSAEKPEGETGKAEGTDSGYEESEKENRPRGTNWQPGGDVG